MAVFGIPFASPNRGKVVAASLINASKAAGKDTAQVRFGAVDLREAKVLARRLWSISELHECALGR